MDTDALIFINLSIDSINAQKIAFASIHLAKSGDIDSAYHQLEKAREELERAKEDHEEIMNSKAWNLPENINLLMLDAMNTYSASSVIIDLAFEFILLYEKTSQL